MINSVTNTALYGMNRAVQIFNRAAGEVLNGSTREAIETRDETEAKQNVDSRNKINADINNSQIFVEDNAMLPSNSVIANIINMNMAKTAYAASAKLYKTSDEMARTILDI